MHFTSLFSKRQGNNFSPGRQLLKIQFDTFADVLQNRCSLKFGKSNRKYQSRRPFFTKVTVLCLATLLKENNPIQVFSVAVFEIFKTP